MIGLFQIWIFSFNVNTKIKTMTMPSQWFLSPRNWLEPLCPRASVMSGHCCPNCNHFKHRMNNPVLLSCRQHPACTRMPSVREEASHGKKRSGNCITTSFPHAASLFQSLWATSQWYSHDGCHLFPHDECTSRLTLINFDCSIFQQCSAKPAERV